MDTELAVHTSCDIPPCVAPCHSFLLPRSVVLLCSSVRRRLRSLLSFPLSVHNGTFVRRLMDRHSFGLQSSCSTCGISSNIIALREQPMHDKMSSTVTIPMQRIELLLQLAHNHCARSSVSRKPHSHSPPLVEEIELQSDRHLRRIHCHYVHYMRCNCTSLS